LPERRIDGRQEGVLVEGLADRRGPDHLTFSICNSEAKAARALARDQNWRGSAVTVDQQQIIER
jgi:hypothetical protein